MGDSRELCDVFLTALGRPTQTTKLLSLRVIFALVCQRTLAGKKRNKARNVLNWARCASISSAGRSVQLSQSLRSAGAVQLSVHKSAAECASR